MSYTVASPNSSTSVNRQSGDSIRVPVRKRTQEDQDKADDKAKNKAEQDLEKSWMDRLQLISVIATFFASTEAQLLSITTPDAGDSGNAVQQAANAGLCGALMFHSFAAILSFTAAFVLIRYRLEEAKRETGTSGSDEEKQQIWSRDPHLRLKRIGYYQEKAPTHLLQRFYTLCISMTVIGFVFAAAGIMCFVWSRQATSVGAFSSASFGVCVIAGIFVLLMTPDAKI